MILQNGKRIDGCSDTVPVGTLQPFVGLTPPKGYLICQGQMVSKATYARLYDICGDAFGPSTTKEFYLPDLRGKTVAGYNANDAAMNSIGKLLGESTHKHTTGNHTLTIAEMPAHTHQDGKNDEGITAQSGSTSAVMHWESTSCEITTTSTGGGQAHNHGDTGVASNYQPTMVMNWIIKAVMLIPEYFIVEDRLDSDSVVDALSARQGKILNEKFTDYATKSEMIQYLPLSGGKLTGALETIGECYLDDGVWGLDMNNSDIVEINGLYFCDPANSHDEGVHFMRSAGYWDTLRGYEGKLYWHLNRPTGTNSDTGYEINTEFRPGDTYQISVPNEGGGGIGGLLSNSNTEIRFVLLLHRGLSKINSITVNTMKLNVRHADGGYVGASSNSAVSGGYDFLANYTITATKAGDNAVNICIKKSSSFGYTNNAPLAIEPNNIKLTFN